MRGAIIGFGNVAAHGHWPAFAACRDIEIVAVADPSPARLRAVAGLVPGARLVESIQQLEASDHIDFVDIATPPSSHAELTAYALERGWHVLCEKPLALDRDVFARLAASAAEAGLVLFTMHNWKVAPILEAAFDAIRNGRIGRVRHVDLLVLRNQACTGAQPGTWRPALAGGPPVDWRLDRSVAGGGILVDHGWHNFYLALGLVGEEPNGVSCALGGTADDPGSLEHTADVAVTFPSAAAALHLTWRAALRRNAAFVVGDSGTLLVDDDRLVVSVGGSTEECRFAAPLSAGSHHEDWFRALLPQFLEEVRDPRRRGANLREAGWCAALVEAAYRSAAGGGREVPVLHPLA